MDDLTGQIIGAAIEVHRELGVGLIESVYESALCHELSLRSIAYQRQVEVNVRYKNVVIQGQRLDLLVQGEVVVELKAQTKLPDFAYAQLISYLKSTGLKRGLLINFAEPKLVNGVKRVSL
ncbi:GxxExxY protein [Methylophilus sp. VKM B-3414]|uniref:GxxExxY protein n=1 Tax=Methylophilus sp. VKM B-3414 TaxID=3076121 RepID=UPI0028C86FFE|nr:GxxExxY protein [Methylophilus sp. VKM B-3414]MDT7848315.1 GxxExxY protein [Methylophilus sp. VKM B-3414]